jgi:conjugative transposon TraM protein
VSERRETTEGGSLKSGQSPTSPDSETPGKVTKKTKEVSSYFNTLGLEKNKSHLISAIIDEEVKAVDGSRVRLRLLDDIEINGITVGKGTYLYASMSGFGKQRVKGKVESIFFDEEIFKVNLSLYDTDGLEGLYVPMSSFRETTQDIASSATQGGNNLTENSTGGTGIKSWASQAMSNATQKAMSALGKNVKKNKVKLKYGTKVYLIDSSSAHGKTKS